MPYSFPPMNSRERRLLHMACRGLEGVETASIGEGQDRFLVVFPEGKTDLPVAPPATRPRFDRGEPRRSRRRSGWTWATVGVAAADLPPIKLIGH